MQQQNSCGGFKPGSVFRPRESANSRRALQDTVRQPPEDLDLSAGSSPSGPFRNDVPEQWVTKTSLHGSGDGDGPGLEHTSPAEDTHSPASAAAASIASKLALATSLTSCPPPPPPPQSHLSWQQPSSSLGLSRARSNTKRSSSRHSIADSMMESSPIKKPRTGASPPRMADIPVATQNGLPTPVTTSEGPTSPLFFSNTPAKNPGRPSSFHPSDTTAYLLARLRDDPAGLVTTLKLPRATVSSQSQNRSGSTPGSWGSSMDASVPSLTPDARTLPPGLQMLADVHAIELVDQDERPTFLLDLANVNRPGLPILYYNHSLRISSNHVLHLLSFDQDDSNGSTEFGQFKAWALGINRTPDGRDLPAQHHQFGGITWTYSTLRKRFRFISATSPITPIRPDSPIPLTETPAMLNPTPRMHSPSAPPTPEAATVDAPDYFGDAQRKSSREESVSEGMGVVAMQEAPIQQHPDEFTNEVLLSQSARPSFDWTRIPMSDSLPEHIRFARGIDWGATSLGPMEDWSNELRAMSNLVMGSPHPAALYWGPDFVALYNAAYIELAGQKHPSLMGMNYAEAWPEIWDEVRPAFLDAWESGQATMKHDNQLFINRHGFSEETFFSWSMVPLVGSDGGVVGLYNPAFENTRRKVTDRRMHTLREIGERTATAHNVKEFWPQVQKGLEYNGIDVPFALIYSVKDDTESEVSSLHSNSLAHTPQLLLEGSIGVPRDHPTAVPSLDLRTSDEGFAPCMRMSMTTGGHPVIISEDAGNLPNHLLQDMRWRGFGDPCRTIVVFPVIPTTAGESVVGFIVMGVNPRRPYDDDYQLFVHLLNRQLATSMASVVLFEEEIKRGQRAAHLAALDRQQLSHQLQLKAQEVNESEYRFTRMAAFAPVGMFIANQQGLITYCNDMWQQISQVVPEGSTDTWMNWMNSVRDEDRPVLQSAWNKLLTERVTISVEFRFNYSQQNDDNTIDTWVLMSAYPEKTEDGQLQSIFGCITDISSQKWAEKVQSERREEAVELKRQQENFIDITSHEMRNPLSAILQCADQITNSISAFAAHHLREEVESLLEGCLDAANTINLCASHQKRIVDDILTLSKLDSNLLTVAPVDEQPVRVIQRALKMFESELITHDIEFEFRVDQSFDDHGIKWAKLDSSRLRQVLINLMTNAIKFTQGRPRRCITVSVAASKSLESFTEGKPLYFDRNDGPRTPSMHIDNEEEWGNGERINIHCSVEDTGPGLGEQERKLLFQRFQQATPRTHVQYGGSGLGLFISRILTEMQGGQIGVSSEPGKGSKFDFYVQSRICTDPPADYEHISPFKIARKAPSPSIGTSPPTEVQPLPISIDTVGGGSLYDVLIVEDNIVNQKVLQRQLKNCGNNTFVANHGQEALETLEKSRFWAGKEAGGLDISVILMDLEMPVMDGMTCARRIRQLEHEGTIVSHIPIIAVTAYARPEQIRNAKAAGIDDVISKPFRIPELLPRIEELVAKYQNLSVSG